MLINTLSVTPFLSPRYGGPPPVVSAYAEGMISRGCNVNTIGTGNAQELKEAKEAGLFELSIKKGNLQCLDKIWPQKWFNARGLSACIQKCMTSVAICHLHMFWDRPHVLAAHHAKKNNVPYVITPHGLLEPWRMAKKKLKKQIFMQLIGNRLLKDASCLHALCDQEVKSFRIAGYKGPVCVIPNGVNAALVNEGHFPDQEDYDKWPQFKNKRVLLFMSRLDKEKGLDILLRAWSKIYSKYPDVILAIAGPDNRGYGLIVKKMIQENSLVDSIKLLGPIYGEKKMSLMRVADAFILPSYSEGFSMAILEALAVGLPAIITPGCNFPEAIKNGAAIEAQPNSHSVAESLITLLTKSSGELKGMKKKGQELILENYTWDICVRKMLTVYDCILGGKDIPLYPEPCNM